MRKIYYRKIHTRSTGAQRNKTPISVSHNRVMFADCEKFLSGCLLNLFLGERELVSKSNFDRHIGVSEATQKITIL